MNKIYKTIIVGGGASGLLCAVELVKSGISGKDILILEKKDRVGKKLIATGNGQGNLTNADINPNHYHGDLSFINGFFNSGVKPDIREYFNGLCLPLCTDEKGRVYPLSKQASSVLDIIRAFLDDNGVKTILSEEVKKVKKAGNVYSVFGVNEYFSENVVLSFGGKAQKQFGTDGTAYKLATDFSHTLTELYPSLVQLKTEKEKIKGLKGLKEYAKLSVKVDGKEYIEEGDILFTDFGISGDSVFKISSVISDKENCIVKIDFLPQLKTEEITDIVQKRIDNNFAFENLLNGIINKRIGQNILKEIGNVTAEKIAQKVKSFQLKVIGTLGFDYAQVTKGGISCKDVNPKTFESKLSKGLYVLGEALNVDGDCGGYNLDFAFSSGIMSAKDISKKY